MLVAFLSGCQSPTAGVGASREGAKISTEQVWVPLELHVGRFAFAPGFVNGAATTLLVDSGASFSVIDRQYARSLGLRSKGSVTALGVGGRQRAGLVTLYLEIGNVQLDVTAAMVDLESVSRSLGREIEVILGQEVFREAVVEIDYPRRRMAFHDPEEFVPPGGGRTLPLQLSDAGAILTELQIEELPPAWFKVDTGSGHTLDCFRAFTDGRGLLRGRSPVSSHVSAGVGGTMLSRVATLRSVTFAGARLRDVPAHFPREAKGVFHTDQHAGNLGAGILRRFRLVFDLGAGQLHVEPGPGALTRAFRKDRLGLLTSPEGGRLMVRFVAPGSPAALRGWGPGEEVTEVEGRAGSPEELRARLEESARGADGQVITVTDGLGEQRRIELRTYY